MVSAYSSEGAETRTAWAKILILDFRNEMKNPQEVQSTPHDPTTPLLRLHTSKTAKILNLKRSSHPYVYGGVIHDSQELDIANARWRNTGGDTAYIDHGIINLL